MAESGTPLLTAQQRRWIDVLLPIATVAVALVAIDLVSRLLAAFSDIILIFFLAWLLAFIISPVVTFLERYIPSLPRGVAVGVVYGTILVAFIGIAIVVATGLASSVANLIADLPAFEARLPGIVASWQEALDRIGIPINLLRPAQQFISGLGNFAVDIQGPLQGIAVSSIGAIGNLVFIISLSVFIVAERDQLEAFLIRLVPPSHAEEARLFETSVSRSFGGFLRGQAGIGAVYGVWALGVHLLLGLPLAPASAATTGLLMAIPFFGPWIAWAPPVLVALFTRPDLLVPTIALMTVGWFLDQNIVVPRLLSNAVGVSPLVVLASVLIGAKVAGIAGAIFALPVVAVIGSFLSYYLDRSTLGPRTVAARAAQRVSAREGRPIRVPSSPSLTEVHARADLEDSSSEATPPGERSESS